MASTVSVAVVAGPLNEYTMGSAAVSEPFVAKRAIATAPAFHFLHTMAVLLLASSGYAPHGTPPMLEMFRLLLKPRPVSVMSYSSAAPGRGRSTAGGSAASSPNSSNPTYALDDGAGCTGSDVFTGQPSVDALKSAPPLPSPTASTSRACTNDGLAGTEHTKTPELGATSFRQAAHGTLPNSGPASIQHPPTYGVWQASKDAAGAGTPAAA